jgi:hypothetical protein
MAPPDLGGADLGPTSRIIDPLNAVPTGTIDVPSRCGRLGAEVLLTNSGGSESFAFLWEKDHYLLAFEDKATGNGDIYTMLFSDVG